MYRSQLCSYVSSFEIIAPPSSRLFWTHPNLNPAHNKRPTTAYAKRVPQALVRQRAARVFFLGQGTRPCSWAPQFYQQFSGPLDHTTGRLLGCDAFAHDGGPGPYGVCALWLRPAVDSKPAESRSIDSFVSFVVSIEIEWIELLGFRADLLIDLRPCVCVFNHTTLTPGSPSPWPQSSPTTDRSNPRDRASIPHH